jgi:hypothetical protein
LISELQLEDAQQFRNFTRISAVEFQSLVNLLGPMIGKQDTAMRNAILVEERVIVTVLFLIILLGNLLVLFVRMGFQVSYLLSFPKITLQRSQE